MFSKKSSSRSDSQIFWILEYFFFLFASLSSGSINHYIIHVFSRILPLSSSAFRHHRRLLPLPLRVLRLFAGFRTFFTLSFFFFHRRKTLLRLQSFASHAVFLVRGKKKSSFLWRISCCFFALDDRRDESCLEVYYALARCCQTLLTKIREKAFNTAVWIYKILLGFLWPSTLFAISSFL